MKIVSKILKILLAIVFIGWVVVLLFDYVNVGKNKDPKFCLSKETKEYSDGTVNICNGLGYKVYRYNRTSYNGIDFGPFWLKERVIK